MKEKFHKKYKPILSSRQSQIIEAYVCGDSAMVKSLMEEVKLEVVEKTKLFEKRCDNGILLEKSGEVISKVSELDETLIDDDNVAKFLLACKLCEQLEGRRNE